MKFCCLYITKHEDLRSSNFSSTNVPVRGRLWTSPPKKELKRTEEHHRQLGYGTERRRSEVRDGNNSVPSEEKNTDGRRIFLSSVNSDPLVGLDDSEVELIMYSRGG